VNRGGTANILYSSLTKLLALSGIFAFIGVLKKETIW